MNKSKLLAIAAFGILAASAASANEVYVGGGFPGRISIGYATKVTPDFGLRAEYSGGTSMSANGNSSGIDMKGTFKSSSAGAFADWYPVSTSGFRVASGLTLNDTKFGLSATGNGMATFNGKSVDMTGEYYNVNVKAPSVSPYIGVGYGHNTVEKGFSFFFDAGITVAKLSVDSSTSLVGSGKVSQSDVDAQTQKVRDSVSKIGFIPKVVIGTSYRF